MTQQSDDAKQYPASPRWPCRLRRQLLFFFLRSYQQALGPGGGRAARGDETFRSLLARGAAQPIDFHRASFENRQLVSSLAREAAKSGARSKVGVLF
jgi:hypothetical protein